MNKIHLRVKQCLILSKYIIAKLLSYLVKRQKKYKELWFICERGTDARDNAYFFYLYLKKCHPELNIVYCITKDSVDYFKVKKIGDTVKYGSFKHLILLNLAKYIISTHNCGHLYERNLFNYKIREKYINKFKAKIIFLQHGITKDYIIDLIYPHAQVDLFICGAKPEYEYITNNFNHPNGVVQYTGLARFDNLHSFQVKRQILLMPTWRLYLNHLDEEEFRQSLYYKRFSNLIKNEELVDLLRKYSYELVFYPHYEVQKYIHLFSANSSLIKIADFDNYDVQQLLKDSALLITDYSSVFFDFAYMHKPILYYQFDREEFFSKHYYKGYFDYKTMGFGEVVENEHDLISILSARLENNCKLQSVYEERINNFFELYDNKNCDRIYEKIIRL